MLRRLEKKDAPLMLEWMQDETICCNFRYPFAEMTLEKVEKFIRYSFDEENQHFAIVDESDEYLGTISLKHISNIDRNAEYSIVMRKKAHGTGIAKHATSDILRYAFNDLGLHRVYLNVLTDNIAGRKLYEKCGFELEGESKDAIRLNDRYRNLAWYAILDWKRKRPEELEM